MALLVVIRRPPAVRFLLCWWRSCVTPWSSVDVSAWPLPERVSVVSVNNATGEVACGMRCLPGVGLRSPARVVVVVVIGRMRF